MHCLILIKWPHCLSCHSDMKNQIKCNIDDHEENNDIDTNEDDDVTGSVKMFLKSKLNRNLIFEKDDQI